MINKINNLRFGNIYRLTNKPDLATAKKAAELFVMINNINNVPAKLDQSNNQYYVLTEEDVLLDQNITNKLTPEKSDQEMENLLGQYDKLKSKPININTADFLIAVNTMFNKLVSKFEPNSNKKIERQQFIDSIKQSKLTPNSPFDKK